MTRGDLFTLFATEAGGEELLSYDGLKRLLEHAKLPCRGEVVKKLWAALGALTAGDLVRRSEFERVMRATKVEDLVAEVPPAENKASRHAMPVRDLPAARGLRMSNRPRSNLPSLAIAPPSTPLSTSNSSTPRTPTSATSSSRARTPKPTTPDPTALYMHRRMSLSLQSATQASVTRASTPPPNHMPIMYASPGRPRLHGAAGAPAGTAGPPLSQHVRPALRMARAEDLARGCTGWGPADADESLRRGEAPPAGRAAPRPQTGGGGAPPPRRQPRLSPLAGEPGADGSPAAAAAAAPTRVGPHPATLLPAPAAGIPAELAARGHRSSPDAAAGWLGGGPGADGSPAAAAAAPTRAGGGGSGALHPATRPPAPAAEIPPRGQRSSPDAAGVVHNRAWGTGAAEDAGPGGGPTSGKDGPQSRNGVEQRLPAQAEPDVEAKKPQSKKLVLKSETETWSADEWAGARRDEGRTVCNAGDEPPPNGRSLGLELHAESVSTAVLQTGDGAAPVGDNHASARAELHRPQSRDDGMPAPGDVSHGAAFADGRDIREVRGVAPPPPPDAQPFSPGAGANDGFGHDSAQHATNSSSTASLPLPAQPPQQAVSFPWDLVERSRREGLGGVRDRQDSSPVAPNCSQSQIPAGVVPCAAHAKPPVPRVPEHDAAELLSNDDPLSLSMSKSSSARNAASADGAAGPTAQPYPSASSSACDPAPGPPVTPHQYPERPRAQPQHAPLEPSSAPARPPAPGRSEPPQRGSSAYSLASDGPLPNDAHEAPDDRSDEGSLLGRHVTLESIGKQASLAADARDARLRGREGRVEADERELAAMRRDADERALHAKDRELHDRERWLREAEWALSEKEKRLDGGSGERIVELERMLSDTVAKLRVRGDESSADKTRRKDAELSDRERRVRDLELELDAKRGGLAAEKVLELERTLKETVERLRAKEEESTAEERRKRDEELRERERRVREFERKRVSELELELDAKRGGLTAEKVLELERTLKETVERLRAKEEEASVGEWRKREEELRERERRVREKEQEQLDAKRGVFTAEKVLELERTLKETVERLRAKEGESSVEEWKKREDELRERERRVREMEQEEGGKRVAELERTLQETVQRLVVKEEELMAIKSESEAQLLRERELRLLALEEELREKEDRVAGREASLTATLRETARRISQAEPSHHTHQHQLQRAHCKASTSIPTARALSFRNDSDMPARDVDSMLTAKTLNTTTSKISIRHGQYLSFAESFTSNLGKMETVEGSVKREPSQLSSTLAESPETYVWDDPVQSLARALDNREQSIRERELELSAWQSDLEAGTKAHEQLAALERELDAKQNALLEKEVAIADAARLQEELDEKAAILSDWENKLEEKRRRVAAAKDETDEKERALAARQGEIDEWQAVFLASDGLARDLDTLQSRVADQARVQEEREAGLDAREAAVRREEEALRQEQANASALRTRLDEWRARAEEEAASSRRRFEHDLAELEERHLLVNQAAREQIERAGTLDARETELLQRERAEAEVGSLQRQLESDLAGLEAKQADFEKHRRFVKEAASEQLERAGLLDAREEALTQRERAEKEEVESSRRQLKSDRAELESKLAELEEHHRLVERAAAEQIERAGVLDARENELLQRERAEEEEVGSLQRQLKSDRAELESKLAELEDRRRLVERAAAQQIERAGVLDAREKELLQRERAEEEEVGSLQRQLKSDRAKQDARHAELEEHRRLLKEATREQYEKAGALKKREADVFRRERAVNDEAESLRRQLESDRAELDAREAELEDRQRLVNEAARQQTEKTSTLEAREADMLQRLRAESDENVSLRRQLESDRAELNAREADLEDRQRLLNEAAREQIGKASVLEAREADLQRLRAEGDETGSLRRQLESDRADLEERETGLQEHQRLVHAAAGAIDKREADLSQRERALKATARLLISAGGEDSVEVSPEELESEPLDTLISSAVAVTDKVFARHAKNTAAADEEARLQVLIVELAGRERTLEDLEQRLREAANAIGASDVVHSVEEVAARAADLLENTSRVLNRQAEANDERAAQLRAKEESLAALEASLNEREMAAAAREVVGDQLTEELEYLQQTTKSNAESLRERELRLREAFDGVSDRERYLEEKELAMTANGSGWDALQRTCKFHRAI
ncbi:hypothetical protein DIPPA_13997 [Diplonema papillatum]|nr:hypothetical protein DIPPA_13997 [Diplonema papillatum]